MHFRKQNNTQRPFWFDIVQTRPIKSKTAHIIFEAHFLLFQTNLKLVQSSIVIASGFFYVWLFLKGDEIKANRYIKTNLNLFQIWWNQAKNVCILFTIAYPNLYKEWCNHTNLPHQIFQIKDVIVLYCPLNLHYLLLQGVQISVIYNMYLLIL